MNDEATPGRRLRSYREACGLTARQAADQAGISMQSVYDMEKGDDGVTLRQIKRYLPVLGVTMGQVFAEDEAPERVPIEFRPLLEPLRDLDQQEREAVIKNVASNLIFMGVVQSRRATRSVVASAEKSMHNSAPSSTATDEPGQVRQPPAPPVRPHDPIGAKAHRKAADGDSSGSEGSRS